MLKIKNTIEDLNFIFSLLKFQYENQHCDIYRLLDVFKRDKHIKCYEINKNNDDEVYDIKLCHINGGSLSYTLKF